MTFKFESETAQAIYEQLEDRYELFYVDYQDSFPEDIYRRALARPRGEGAYEFERDVENAFELYPAAYEAVLEAAAGSGFNLRSPFVSLDENDFHVLVDQVMERNVSDVESVIESLSSRDVVMLGMKVDDEWFDDSSDESVWEKLHESFGLPEKREWMETVRHNGYGEPVILFGVYGFELYEAMREARDKEGNVEVRIVAWDAGLIDRFGGAGWICSTGEEPIEMTVPFEWFRKRTWVDNEPGARGTWTEIVGRAEASRPGILEVVG